MNREEHITFIRSQLSNIPKEVICTANHIGCGMEANMVTGYLLQSLFLQMTGAQEQKMKCICWEMATNDLKYRYKRYYKGWTLSECSTLEDKSHVYEDLLSSIHRMDATYKLFNNDADKTSFVNEITNNVCTIFDATNIVEFQKTKYKEFKDFFSNLHPSNIVPTSKVLFKKGDKDFPVSNVTTDTEMFAVYSILYNQRNKCAHNTTSYQLNLPHLQDLRDAKYQKYDNMFIFLTTLIIIDEIFRRLFDKYMSLINIY